jgi:hypothetical protein
MTEASSPASRCVVNGAEQLPAGLGGADAVCAAIDRAVKGADASVVVTIVSPHAMVANVTAGGRTLPEQRVDVSDHELTARSIEMLANSVARVLAGPATE